jgi:hypothetical protein
VRPILKIPYNNKKKAGGATQVVELLLASVRP